jgi:hypothetical protein
MQTLTDLDLADNRIGPRGSQYLSDVLRKNTVKTSPSFHGLIYYLIYTGTHENFPSKE